MESMNVKHNDTFNTPNYIFKQLDDIFNFTYDGACDSSNVKCKKGAMFDKGVNGLESNWEGHRVFCNPPFSHKKEWIKKAIKEVETNNCHVCLMVLPLNCMSTSFFYDLVIKGGYKYQIPKGRIQFLDNNTKNICKGNNSGSVLVYFMKDVEI